MRLSVAFAREHLELEIADDRLVARPRSPLPLLADPSAAIRAALESPFHFPALHRALTPDDRIAVVVDEQLPNVGRLLVPVLEHIASAGVAPAAVTVVCAPSASRQEWVEDLPDDLQDVLVEVHDPTDRKRLSYVATTSSERRLYLNRTVADADQVVVLGRRYYDGLLGHAGAEGDLFPALSDEPTRTDLLRHWNFTAPDADPWPLRQQAQEAGWLLGMPFFVQIVAGAGDSAAEVIAGTSEASAEGQRRLDACWRQEVPTAADLVVASVSGDPARHTFADLAAAAACAARVVRADGRIILITRASPDVGPGSEILRGADDPHQAQRQLQREQRLELVPALQWARATAHARVSLLSELPDETVEELHAAPLPDLAGVKRWLDRGGSCLFLEDAHKALAVLRG
jgi:nickel-dependent lactate racemase